MKDKAGLIVPILMMLVGIYVLITAFGSSGEQVNVISDHQIPRGLAMMFGPICLVGGGVVMMTSLSKRKTLS
jgi:divalent metal cation (Fe/Co/Zn/Cd) transporter